MRDGLPPAALLLAYMYSAHWKGNISAFCHHPLLPHMEDSESWALPDCYHSAAISENYTF